MNIKKMLPFLSIGNLEELTDLILDKKTDDITLSEIVPFLGNEGMKQIYERFINGNTDIEIIKLLPFMDETLIMDLYQRINKGEVQDIKEESLLPFLGEEQIKILFADYVKSKRD